MATHRITVQIGGNSPLEDTEANRRRVFIFSGSLGASVGNIGVNMGARVPPAGEYAIDLNHPRVPGTISVSSYSPQKYESEILKGQPGLVDQLSTAIERGYIEVMDEDATVQGQTGANASMGAAAGGLITVTGLSGMTEDSVGRFLEISGTANADNAGRFLIAQFNDATSVDVLAGGAPGNDDNNGALNWAEKGVELTRADLSALL